VIRVAERGYGAALRAGIAGARGPYIVMGDADDSYDFTDVPRFVEKLREGHDIVLGNRFRVASNRGPCRRSTSTLAILVSPRCSIPYFMHALETDTAGCGDLRAACTTSWILRSEGMEFALEMVIKSTQIGARIAEIPIVLWPDKRGRAPISAVFEMDGAACGSCCCMRQTGFSCCQGPRLVLAGLALVFWLLPGRDGFLRMWCWTFTR